jgi:O-antigen/teichoic acid export membrane protein
MTRPADNPAASGGFLLNVNLVFIATVAASGLGFVTAVLLARTLGPEGRGVTALYQAAVSLGFAFLSLGIATAIVYYVARRDISGRQAMEAGLSITLIATAFTALGVVIAAVAFGSDLADEDVPYWLALVAIPALVQFRAAEAVLRAQGRFGAMNLLEVSLPLSILSCLAAVELAEGLTIYRAVVAWSLAFLPPVVIGYALLGPSQWPRRLAGRDLLWQAARFGVQGQLSNLIQLLNYRLDSYLVLILVNASGVGLYAVGVSLSEGMWLIANSVSVVLLTNLTAGDEANAARMTPIICRNTLLVTAAGAVAAAAVSPVAVPLIFGDAFNDAVVPFLWLLPGTVALAGTKILAAYVFSRGRPLINAQIAFVTLVVTIVADLALIPPFEVAGAAAASSLAYCCSLALSLAAYRRLSGGAVVEALLPRFSDVPYYRDGARSIMARLRGSEARP